MRTSLLLPALLLAAACGDPASPATDAPPPLDAEVPDAEVPDAEPDALVPDMMVDSCELPLPCPTPSAGKMSVCGRLFDLATSQPIATAAPTFLECGAAGAATDGPCALQLSFHDALKFAGGGGAQDLPVDTLTIDDCGRFRAVDITRPSLGFIALAVDDADGSPDLHRLTGEAFPATAGAVHADRPAFVVGAATEDAWTTQAGLTGESFAERGVIFAKFLHGATPVAGVTLTSAGTARPADTFYVTGDAPASHATVAAGLTATGATGAALMIGSNLVDHSGTGGEAPGCTWPGELAASIPGVVLYSSFVMSMGGAECP